MAALDGTASGTVATGGDGLHVRAEPNTSSSILDTIDDGTTVTIGCQIQGDDVGGDDVWDYLPDYGGYVADEYLLTGFDSYIDGVPICGDSGGSGDGSGTAGSTGNDPGGSSTEPPPSGGDLGAAIVAEARMFLGYHETSTGYCNEFSSALGRPCEQWCADYAQYVWQHAGAQTGGLSAAAISFYSYGANHGTWKDGAYASNVQPGDAVIWANSYSWAEHVGLVTEVHADGTISVINGDFFDDGSLSRVSEVTISRSDDVGTGAPILGYASPVQ
ncbi:MAG TPA: CHAP domain-containing protein [Minicystis sp.]|nr:CHAP domain-containing protein [Minicystis sp.]